MSGPVRLSPWPRTCQQCWTAWIAVVSLSLLVGCNSSSPVPDATVPAASSGISQVRDNLGLAIDILQNLDRYEPVVAHGQILSNLNQWIESQPANAVDWKEDPLIQRMPGQYRELDVIQGLANREFASKDVLFLQGTMLIQDVALRVSQTTDLSPFGPIVQRARAKLSEAERNDFAREADRLSAALRVLDTSLSERDSRQLAACLRLFDWTIRNTRLDKMLKRPTLVAAGPQRDQAGRSDVWQTIDQPGPGYQLFPWQVLMYGHGDAWERGRLLIHLARQVGIDMLMLGTDETGRISRADAWLPAALINDQLYLFDAALGLPIPGPDGQPVATLKQVKDDPQLLRALDIKPLRYPMDADKLKQVVGLIDVEPEQLALRMAMIEQRLTGDSKMVLSFQPTPLEQQVRQTQGLNVGLWTIPLDTLEHRRRVAASLRSSPAAARRYFRTEGPYQGGHPMAQARRQHLRAVFESDESEMQTGAKTLYLRARMPAQMIDRLADDEQLQEDLGLYRQPEEDPAIWKARVAQIQVLHEAARIDAAFFLALAHYATQDYGDAVTWLERARSVDTEGIWEPAIQYNLGRAYEAMGNLDKAIKLYQAGFSAQQHGNLLRARLLEDWQRDRQSAG